MSIAENITNFKKELPPGVALLAVSKTQPVSKIMEAYKAGQRMFGENKAQEMALKHPEMPPDTEWHMIGHLQRNKVKMLAPFVKCIHSVDSSRLLMEIDKQGKRNNRIIEVLLQLRIAREDSKYGMTEEQILELLRSDEFKRFQFVKPRGLMGMASFTGDEAQIKREFERLLALYERLHNTIDQFDVLSMGMSADYKLAIECGSNLVRIGSSIFGDRNI